MRSAGGRKGFQNLKLLLRVSRQVSAYILPAYFSLLWELLPRASNVSECEVDDDDVEGEISDGAAALAPAASWRRYCRLLCC